MKDTVEDLWKMMWEYQCGCIMMLCELMEDGQVYYLYTSACAHWILHNMSYIYRRVVIAIGQEKWGRRWCMED